MKMQALPAALRPREKLLALGAAALADAELLALLLRTGHRGQPVLALAAELLSAAGGLAALLQAAPRMPPGCKGLGPAKAAELAAVMELARRATGQRLRRQPLADQPEELERWLRMQLGNRRCEAFGAAFLDGAQRLLAWEEMFQGDAHASLVCPREVARRALALGAQAVVVAHNHPCGGAEPSAADWRVTERLRQTLGLIDVALLDHLIVGEAEVVWMSHRAGW